MTSPSVGVDGRSFAECTATSARPSSTATWTSFTKTPCPPIWCSGDVLALVAGRVDEDELDRAARIGCLEDGGRRPRPACAPARSIGWPAGAGSRHAHCRSNRSRTAAGVALAARRADVVLQPHRRAVQQLGHDAASDGLDRFPLRRRQRREPPGLTGRARPARTASARSCSCATSGAACRAVASSDDSARPPRRRSHGPCRPRSCGARCPSPPRSRRSSRSSRRHAGDLGDGRHRRRAARRCRRPAADGRAGGHRRGRPCRGR